MSERVIARQTDHKATAVRGATSVAVVTEGEFDAILLRQETEGAVGVATMGGVRTPLTARWLLSLAGASLVLAAHDADPEGDAAADALERMSPRVKRARPIGAKDLDAGAASARRRGRSRPTPPPGRSAAGAASAAGASPRARASRRARAAARCPAAPSAGTAARPAAAGGAGRRGDEQVLQDVAQRGLGREHPVEAAGLGGLAVDLVAVLAADPEVPGPELALPALQAEDAAGPGEQGRQPVVGGTGRRSEEAIHPTIGRDASVGGHRSVSPVATGTGASSPLDPERRRPGTAAARLRERLTRAGGHGRAASARHAFLRLGPASPDAPVLGWTYRSPGPERCPPGLRRVRGRAATVLGHDPVPAVARGSADDATAGVAVPAAWS